MADRTDLARIPSVDSVLSMPEVEGLYDLCDRRIVADLVRASLGAMREAMLAGELQDADRKQLLVRVVGDVHGRVAETLSPRLKPVVNATGIVLHTNLGRAPLSRAAVDRLVSVAQGYTNLEIDLDTGQRGSRNDLVESLLTDLTGAEAAAVVNNNAAAVLLVLNTLAMGREAVVSRGQLIEIGGSFRLPDIMARSGVNMVEVGTTNRTHLSDYESAISDRTGLIVAAHTSNYRVMGFTSTVALDDLAALGHRYGIPVVHDLGGGVLVNLESYGLPYEPLVSDSVKAGVGVITFSGDKVLGGPQSGIIVGRKDLLARIRANPLMRAVRCGKLTYAALEATLRLYLKPADLLGTHPTLRMLTAGLDVLRRRANGLVRKLSDLSQKGWSIDVVDAPSQAGSGTLPMEEIPSVAIRLQPAGISAGEVARRMRRHSPPVLGYVREDILYLNLRTVFAHELKLVAEAVLCSARGCDSSGQAGSPNGQGQE